MKNTKEPSDDSNVPLHLGSFLTAAWKSEPNHSKLRFLFARQSWDSEIALCRRDKTVLTLKTKASGLSPAQFVPRTVSLLISAEMDQTAALPVPGMLN